jgi:alpha-beta hydrolase superfamily lysophospholipase
MQAQAQAQEVWLQGSDGLRLAARRWEGAAPRGDAAGRRVLAVHGWLDNASSFDLLVPALLAQPHAPPTVVVAIDLPGHGRSDTRPGPLSFLDPVEAVLEALEALQWPSCHLLGHSLVHAPVVVDTPGVPPA